MNKQKQRFLLFFLLASFCSPIMAEADNILLSAVLNRVNKVTKKPVHKAPLEYHQAVERYMAYTKTHCLSSSITISNGKLLSYEMELRYLFNNYAKFSTLTLLSRLHSSHCEMIQSGYDTHQEKYQHYEQICSALLLQCAQMLSDNVRKQLLDALHEIDDLIVYWQYQKNHPIRYCFGKSPFKWVIGKSQDKEVSSNLKRLAYKQSELYAMLGTLTTHVHDFTECGMSYTDCYTWIEKLLSIVSCIKTDTDSALHGTRFDIIAQQLELKLRSVGKLKYDCLRALASAQKSNHFVRHWIAYTAAAAITAYAVRYHIADIPIVFDKITSATSSVWSGVVENPMNELKTALVGKESNASVSSLEKRAETMRQLGDKFVSSVDKELNKMEGTFEDWAKDFYRYSLNKAKKLDAGLFKDKDGKEILIESIIDEAFNDGNTTNFTNICKKVSIYYYDDRLDMEEARLFWGGLIVLQTIKPWSKIIDEGIVPSFGEADYIGGDLVDLVVAFARDHKWTSRLAMFSPLACVGLGVVKLYQWVSKYNYSPIRLALADVNSLLIESTMPLDDYDYGKLVYLVHKLRNKAYLLKDALSDEFLVDVTKLESKRFDGAAKRGIVDNMFNKYAFLGRIAQ